MIHAATRQEIAAKRQAFRRKGRLKCPAAASLEEAGGKLFAFTRVPESQWKPLRASNAIARLHAAFKRRIKTQTVLPGAETAAMLFRALMASGQIAMRKAGGWQSLNERPSGQALDLAALPGNLVALEIARKSFPTEIATASLLICKNTMIFFINSHD